MTYVVQVTETPLAVTIDESELVVNVTEVAQSIELATMGPQGATGPTGPSGLMPVFTRQGSLTAFTGTSRLYMERSGTVAKVRASVGVAPVGSGVVVDLKKNGTSIGYPVTIAAGAFTAFVTPNVAVTSGDYLTVDILSVGSVTPGSGLTVTVSIE